MEVLIKIGDSGGSKDGQIIACKPDGWLIPGAAMAAWIDDGTEPAILDDMPQYQADRLRRRVNCMRWELSHTPAEIVAEFDILPARLSKDADAILDATTDATERKALAVSDRARMVAHGLDTNWGFEDLKTHFALALDSDDPHDLIELVDSERDTDHKAKITAKRRNRVDYKPQYDAKVLADITDKTKRLDVDRVTKLARSTVKPLTVIVETSK